MGKRAMGGRAEQSVLNVMIFAMETFSKYRACVEP
jgi:hypothetical protein